MGWLRRLHFPSASRTIGCFPFSSNRVSILREMSAVPWWRRTGLLLRSNFLRRFRGNFETFHPALEAALADSCLLLRPARVLHYRFTLRLIKSRYNRGRADHRPIISPTADIDGHAVAFGCCFASCLVRSLLISIVGQCIVRYVNERFGCLSWSV